MIQFAVSRNFAIHGKHGKSIYADLFKPIGEGPFPVVIFAHGFKGFKDWGPFNLIASQFAYQGYVFVKINFAFNGTTPETPLDFTDLDAFGKNNLTKELDDLEVTINWIHEHADEFSADVANIALLGHSRGGGISILKANEDDRVSKVAAWASVAGFDRHISREEILKWKKTGIHHVENARTNQMMPLYIQLYDDFIKNHRRFDIQNTLESIKKPVFLAHAADDDTIPLQDIIQIALLNPLNVRLLHLESGGHTFSASHPFEGENLPNEFQVVVRETLSFLGNQSKT